MRTSLAEPQATQVIRPNVSRRMWQDAEGVAAAAGRTEGPEKQKGPPSSGGPPHEIRDLRFDCNQKSLFVFISRFSLPAGRQGFSIAL